MSEAIGKYYVRFDWQNKIGHKKYACLWKWTPATGWVSINGDGKLHHSSTMKTPNEMTWYESNYKDWMNTAKALRA